MYCVRFATLLIAMLVMVSPFAQARPLHGQHRTPGHLLLRHTSNFTNYDHLVRRQYGYASSISQNTPRVSVVRRTTSDDQGDVSLHDDYESQLHALEAALKHYEEFGDAKSLQTYLNGFIGAGHGAAVTSANGKGKDAPAQDDKKWKKTAAKQQNDAENQEGQQVKKPHVHHKQENKPKQIGDDCEPGSDDHDGANIDGSQASQGSLQPQPQQPTTQQQTKKTKKVPKKAHDSSDDRTQPSTSPFQAQPQPQPDQPASPELPSINGYTPPPFTTHPTSPSTASLYTASPFTGHATFYNTGLGACGITNYDNEPIVAVSRDVFEQYNPSSGNPNHNSLCGKKIEISWKGKMTHAFATDECPGCEPHSLDCSPSVFERLDDKDKGVLDGISWRFV
ncbi:hypothetical protein EX895_002855 [Sporisorium graminicola]|uniref:RlpA-like protein double-psi beta-barrel domain-containing protein n=1 Tax=Sporisorium graminicola TaxID=280036 RepID=A0A4U7KU41_9BASI|nr:hypothetical protein EX895_002855 [Sporisorium graminicola]TKY88145.1 hypothetical protein EX895_002855 [Sporisorium graminicola]